MNTCIWGPPLWRILHSVGFAPVEALNKRWQVVQQLLESLKYVLPCRYCRDSYTQFVAQLPPATPTTLAGWLVDLHNLVNVKLGVPEVPFKTVQLRYTIRPVSWCPADLWDVVSVVGLNYSASVAGAYVMWWWGLMGVAGMHYPDVADAMRRVLVPATSMEWVVTAVVLEAAVAGVRSPSTQEVQARLQQYELARASTCIDGKCQ